MAYCFSFTKCDTVTCVFYSVIPMKMYVAFLRVQVSGNYVQQL